MNFDHSLLLAWSFVRGEGILNQWQYSIPHFLLCLYILQVVMIWPDFGYDHPGLSKIHSYHKINNRSIRISFALEIIEVYLFP